MLDSQPARPGVLARARKLALCLLVAATPACYHYRVSAPQVADLSQPLSETKLSLLWGLVQEADTDTSCVCLNNGLKEVTASTNLGYTLLGLITLGIVVPLDVSYVCGKPGVGAPFPDPPRDCPGVAKLEPPAGGPPEPDAGTEPAPEDHDPDEGSF